MEPPKESSNVATPAVEATQTQPAQTEPVKAETETAELTQGETDRRRLQAMVFEIEELNQKESDDSPKKSNNPVSQEVKTEYDENSKLREMVANLKETLREKNLTLTRKNLQTEALEIQISALKEVTILSKGMLDIRNMENLQLKDQIDSMQAKITAERERHNFVLKKAERASTINNELQNEYHKQILVEEYFSNWKTDIADKVALFGELKESYEKKLSSLKAEIKRLEELQNSTST